ncbi:kiSS-1 receptor [Brachionus plicatilis]|uniref:KiSS-1 receptor n=1 Tax=Brachionus plicatilis TaxID=10195 RepID=A0A3M7QIS9_BRAPC|nr:kiSS-1 receptor [Brachionus plicatilis]
MTSLNTTRYHYLCYGDQCPSLFTIWLSYFIESGPYKSMIAIVWLSLVIFGILGNGLVIFIAIFYKKLNDITNCYIFNLAITDMLFVIFCIPFTMYIYLYDNWFFGVTFCKLNHFMSHASVQSTCLTLTAMTIHRCNLIIKNKTMTQHLANIKRRQRTVLLITIGIWLLSFLIASPDLIYYTVTKVVLENNETFKVCSYDKDTYSILVSYISISHVISIATTYVIPLLIIILSYTRLLSHLSKNQRRLAKFNKDERTRTLINRASHTKEPRGAEPVRVDTKKARKSKKSENRKKKVTTMVAVVTLNFGICWLPTHLFIIFKPSLSEYPYLFPYLSLFKLVAHTLSYLTPVINPCLYAFYNENFRNSFYDLCFRVSCKKQSVNRTKVLNKSMSKSVL